MPMLADIDDPPGSRAPGLLMGVVFAVPVAIALGAWLVPAFVGAVLAGAHDLDQRLEADEAYMRAVCLHPPDPERSDALCRCVAAAEFPPVDCRAQFNAWALELQRERCKNPVHYDQAVSFCTCVETVFEQRKSSVHAYENCEALSDALERPAPHA